MSERFGGGAVFLHHNLVARIAHVRFSCTQTTDPFWHHYSSRQWHSSGFAAAGRIAELATLEACGSSVSPPPCPLPLDLGQMCQHPYVVNTEKLFLRCGGPIFHVKFYSLPLNLNLIIPMTKEKMKTPHESYYLCILSGYL